MIFAHVNGTAGPVRVSGTKEMYPIPDDFNVNKQNMMMNHVSLSCQSVPSLFEMFWFI